jgi:hypothetical protein
MFALINKINFILSSMRDSEAVFLTRRGGATQNLNKIYLPEGPACRQAGNLDFAQSLRYVSSEYIHTSSSTSLGLSQNQGFNSVKTFI